MLFIPRDNFDKNNYFIYCALSIAFVAVIGLLWNNFYASPALYHSWRAQYFIQNNVNVENQLSFIFSHPLDFIVAISNILYSLPTIFSSFFNFYNGHEYCASQFISMLLTFFVVFVSLYPSDIIVFFEKMLNEYFYNLMN